MKLMGLIRQLIRDYFIIFGILIIGSVFLTPTNTINRDYILLTVVFAAIGDLPSIVFWSRSGLVENSSRLRMIIHFIMLEVVIIYAVVRFITWRSDLATAKRLM